VSRFEWPDLRALLDDFAEYLGETGTKLVVVSPGDLEAGVERARLAEHYDAGLGACDLAALLFDGIATRHPLLDGNKRLAWQAMTTFLLLNGLYVDASEREAADFVLDVVTRKRAVADLANYLLSHTFPADEQE
jgi:death-on-curing protein